ncbi:MAG: hypothetical protein V3R99_12365 [Thermoguttaceae bacterium]
MRKIALCLLMPALLAAGSILVGADRAEARVRHRGARVVVVPRAAYRYYHPRVYVGPRVHVYGPRVQVHVGPRPYISHGYYGHGHGSVVVPGVHVHW